MDIAHNLMAEMLRRAMDDWVSVIEIEDAVVKTLGGDAEPDAVRAVVVKVIGDLASEKLVVAGHIDEHGFAPYDTDEDISLLVSSVLDAPDPMGEYSRLWLSITTLGARQASPNSAT